ncbi:hypothetical protein ACSZOP_06875 [Colibacter massiliensis]|uniref:hypothetical protein n=1 Tax=Colibacter massiliensis TaxID=1852379 RepID=UPI003F9192EA
MDEEYEETDEGVAEYESQQNIPEPEAKSLEENLQQLSSLLAVLNGQLRVLEGPLSKLDQQANSITKAGTQIYCVAQQFPKEFTDQCLQEYQKILSEVAGNFNNLVKASEQWQKQHDETIFKEKQKTYREILFFLRLAAVLLVLLCIKMFVI